MKFQAIKRTSIVLLLLCFLVSMNSALPAFPQEPVSPTLNEDLTIEETIIGAEFLSAEAVQNTGHVKRMRDDEPNLNTAVFENEDGTYTMYVFAHTIKYVDESGNIKDKSNTLTASFSDASYTANYAYGIENNEFKTYFPKTLNETNGVSLKLNEHTIVLSAKGTPSPAGNIQEFSPDNAVVYPRVFGENTLLRYKPTFSGYKEELILGAVPADNSFEFMLDIGELSAELLSNGSIILYTENDDAVLYADESAAAAQEIGLITPFSVYDAAGNRTENNQVTLQELESGVYELTLQIDDAFLNSDQTVYPVVAAPAIVLQPSNGTQKATEDVYISNTNNSSFTQWNGVGSPVLYSSTSESRTLLRFPGFEDSTNTTGNLTYLRNHAAVINKAEVWLYDTDNLPQRGWVDVYSYLSTWAESDGFTKTITSSTFHNTGSFLDSRGVGDSSGYTGIGSSTTGGRWYNFSFASALKEWVSSSSAPSAGTALKGIALCPYYDEENNDQLSIEFADTEYDPDKVCYVVNYSDYTYYNWRWLFDDVDKTKNISSGYKRNDRPDHYGIDLAENPGYLIEGTAIKSPTSATVIEKGNDTRGYYIILETGVKDLYEEKNIRLVFMHLQAPSPLSVGNTVVAGTLVGNVGNTGNSTGPHLHFSVIRNGATTENSSNTLNPQRFFTVNFSGKTSTVRP